MGKAAGTVYNTAVQASLPLISEQGKLQSQVSSLQTLQSDLTTLQTAIQSLGSQSTWNSVTASSSNTNAATISASSGAPQTSVSFTVNQLAQGQISTLSGLTATNATNPASTSNGTLTITGGLGNANVSISSGDSLNTIASNINNDASTTGVQASVIPVNVSGSTQYELMLSSTQIGATKGAFTINSSQGFALTSVQPAQDANLTLGTGSSGVMITSATNTFTNALPNTSITAVSTGTGTISIQSDPQAVTKAMKALMDAYNSVESQVYSGGGASDTTIGQLIAGQLPSAINTSVSTDTMFTSLSQVGALLSPGSYAISNGSFSSTAAPSLGWQSAGGVSGVSLPSGVTFQDGSTTFTNAVQSNRADLQNFLGVTSSGLKLPSGSFLGQLSAQVKLWQQDLSGATVNGTTVTGEISQLQNQIGTSGSTAAPGSVNYSLNQLEQQYTSQVQSLVSQWSAAQASIMLASSQMTSLQAMQSLTSSSYYQLGTMLGG
ncbi:flagellar filament capping protein FliD [Alicyclobacillus curvatus]|nr:flagellar filament capping protein FliD [Alicyclobacillus curvatus]